jgi:hypothetical protein
MTRDIDTENQLWQDPDWNCPHCEAVNRAIREKCRTCGYDSNAGEFPYYNPLPPYDGLPKGGR